MFINQTRECHSHCLGEGSVVGMNGIPVLPLMITVIPGQVTEPPWSCVSIVRMKPYFRPRSVGLRRQIFWSPRGS